MSSPFEPDLDDLDVVFFSKNLVWFLKNHASENKQSGPTVLSMLLSEAIRMLVYGMDDDKFNDPSIFMEATDMFTRTLDFYRNQRLAREAS